MNLIPNQEVTMVSSNVTDTTNRDKMFNEYLNEQTEFADLIEVEIEFNNCDRVALMNIDATDVDLELTNDDTSTVVQTKNIDLEMSDGIYLQWVIEPMYIYANATLKITLNNSGSTAKCGKCGIGLSTEIGKIHYMSPLGLVDYSIKDTNEFGQTYLNPGSWAKRIEAKTVIPKSTIDAVFEDLVDVRGSFVFFEGNHDDLNYESLRLFGFVEDWQIALDYPYHAGLSLIMQGTI